MLYRGAYHLTEKSSWGVESIMVSDLPVYRRNATSILRFDSKKGRIRVAWVWNREGTEKLLNGKQNSVWFIPTGMKAKTTSKRTPQFLVGIISKKWPYHLPSIQNFGNFLSNSKHPRCMHVQLSKTESGCSWSLPSYLLIFFWSYNRETLVWLVYCHSFSNM